MKLMKYLVLGFELLKLNLTKIAQVVSYYENLSENENQINAKPDIFFKISSNWHFSVTQSFQLENLLRRLKVFCDNNEIMDSNSSLNLDKKFIRIFTSRIEDFGDINNKKDIIIH